ncbi:MAG: hypothetical protein ACYC4T_02590 [Melioribacteraceae bacterium]
MTLLPIIYTSVLIFSAFMIFVISLSYIIYKAKSKDRVPVYLKHIDPLENRFAVQPLRMNNSVIKQTSFSVSLPSQKKILPLSPVKMKSRNDEYTQAVNVMNKEKYSRQRNEQVNQNENSIRKSSYKSKPISARIEVMNNSEKYKTKVTIEENKKVTSPNSYTNHGDVNLLTFYSDKLDLDLVSLSAPRASKAI